MKASTFITERRSLGSWLAYALPDDSDDTRRPPDPPEERRPLRTGNPERPELPASDTMKETSEGKLA